MRKSEKVIAIILIPAILLFVLFLPDYVDDKIAQNPFEQWLEHKKEHFSGIITVWHVVEFKPYVGSLGNVIKNAADSIEKNHFKVYLDVTALSSDDAAQLIQKGEFPDVISFPKGFVSEASLHPLSESERSAFDNLVDLSLGENNSVVYAIPFVASCEFVIYNPDKITSDELTVEIARQNSADDFKKGKASCCMGDAHTVGQFMRLVASQKLDAFELIPIDSGTDLVQFLGIDKNCDENKLSYIFELFSVLLNKKSQKTLCEIGLLPLLNGAELSYEQHFLETAYKNLRDENSFGNFLP